MICFKIDFVQIRADLLPKVFVKFTGKTITPKGFVICHGKGSLLKIYEGEKLLTESMLLNRKAVRSNRDAFSESLFLRNRISLGSKDVLIMMNECLKDVGKTGKNSRALLELFNPNIGMTGSKSMKKLL